MCCPALPTGIAMSARRTGSWRATRSPARGVDRDSRAGAGLPNPVRAGPDSACRESSLRGTPHQDPVPAARAVGLSIVRLRVLSDLDSDIAAEALLLPLPGVGRLPISRGAPLYEPPGAARCVGRAGLGRGHPPAGESIARPPGNRSPAGGVAH